MRTTLAPVVAAIIAIAAAWHEPHARAQEDGGQDAIPQARVAMTPRLALALLQVSEEDWLDCRIDPETRDPVRSEDGSLVCNDAAMRAIHASILSGARRSRVSYVRFAAMYARGVIGRQRLVRRPWLWGLNPAGTEPERWPTMRAVHVRARRVRQGEDCPIATVTVTGRRGYTAEVCPAHSEQRAHLRWTSVRDRWLRTYEQAGRISQLRLDDWQSWLPCERVPSDWGSLELDSWHAELAHLVPISCGSEDDRPANQFYVRPSVLAEEQLGG